jgi:O-antigen/teichoic acid export membrane protein
MTLNLRQTGGNVIAILTSDVMNRATSFVLYALVARHLGAREFGQLALAFTLFYAFQVLAAAGLKTLITREVAKDRSQTGLYFVNGSVLVVISSVCSFVALLAFVHILQYPPDTRRVILLLALGLLPYAFSAICEGIFQAWERMHYIAWVNVPLNVIKIACAFLLLSGRYGLDAVVLIVVSSLVAIAGIEGWMILRRFPRHPARFMPSSSLAMIRSSGTFLGIDGIIAITSGLNVLLLSKLASETQVGFYSAAMQLMVPLSLVYQSVARSIFPLMCKQIEPGLQNLKRIAEGALEVLLALALPAVAGIFLLGEWLLTVAYQDAAFLEALPALRIISWILIFQAFSAVLGQVLWASSREGTTLRIVVTAVLINLVLGWPLISYFGLTGAAVTALLTKAVGCVQHYIPVSRLFSGISLGEIIWKPAAAAAFMAAYLAMPLHHGGILAGVAAALIYFGALFALTVWASGGVRQFKSRIAYSWPESPSGSEEARS